MTIRAAGRCRARRVDTPVACAIRCTAGARTRDFMLVIGVRLGGWRKNYARSAHKTRRGLSVERVVAGLCSRLPSAQRGCMTAGVTSIVAPAAVIRYRAALILVPRAAQGAEYSVQ